MIELNRGIFWRQVELTSVAAGSGANTGIKIVK
jgi:hypothetical protein